MADEKAMKSELKVQLEGLLDSLLDEASKTGEVRYLIPKHLKDMVIKDSFKDDVFYIVNKYTDKGITDEGTQKLEELNECMEALLNKVQELKGE